MPAVVAPPGPLVEGGGLVLGAGLVAAALALLHRWYSGRKVPVALSSLAGLGGVALYLNTTASLGMVLGGEAGLLSLFSAGLHLAVFGAAWVSTLVGSRVGDILGMEVLGLRGESGINGGVGRVVRAVGRVIRVTLPESVGDIEGYEPVSRDVKEDLAGSTMAFPRGLTAEELEERLAARLKTDHGVGKVDVAIDGEGVVTYLALGEEESGIGPSLPQGSAAVAVLADPPAGAGAGDVVNLYGEEGERLLSGEVRGVDGDSVTLAVDEVDAGRVDPGEVYSLATLPRSPRPEREFASILREAEETLGILEVEEGGGLDGMEVGEIEETVIALRRGDGEFLTIPPRSTGLSTGDVLYVVARPEALRRLSSGSSDDVKG